MQTTIPAVGTTALVWFRRDLRCEDHAPLHHALLQCSRVFAFFVFDREILDPLPRQDRRVAFIRDSLVELDADLREIGGGRPGVGLIVRHGAAVTELMGVVQALKVQVVYASHDDEPQSLERDEQARLALQSQGVAFHTFKDHVVFERQEVLTQSGRPYGVFTPYKNAWLKKLQASPPAHWLVKGHGAALAERPAALRQPVPSLHDIGFETPAAVAGQEAGARAGQRLVDDFRARMDHYAERRDFPAVRGPSYLSVHLRFGTVSVRQLVALARERQTSQADGTGAAVWLGELIWRDFYAQVLANFPHVANSSFKPAYDAIDWEQGEPAQALFAAWCEGRTGYPLVDAAMAQINQTGYMHNRLRMVVASFLVKDLGIDWRWGEAYFARQLIDFDLASNNGGWQWASSSGCDAQPYFRIFNPVSQSQKFDSQGKFIRRYVPQLAGLPDAALHAPWLARPIDLQSAGLTLGKHYPTPVVDHASARTRTLQRYAVVKAADAAA